MIPAGARLNLIIPETLKLTTQFLPEPTAHTSHSQKDKYGSINIRVPKERPSWDI